MWISWATHHLTRQGDPVVWHRVTLPGFSDEPPDLPAVEEGLRGFRENAAILDDALQGRKWLVGNSVSYADFRVATLLPFAAKAELPIGEFHNISRWHGQLLELDAWRDPFKGLE
jgi:glutathione S-transferase